MDCENYSATWFRGKTSVTLKAVVVGRWTKLTSSIVIYLTWIGNYSTGPTNNQCSKNIEQPIYLSTTLPSPSENQG